MNLVVVLCKSIEQNNNNDDNNNISGVICNFQVSYLLKIKIEKIFSKRIIYSVRMSLCARVCYNCPFWSQDGQVYQKAGPYCAPFPKTTQAPICFRSERVCQFILGKCRVRKNFALCTTKPG
jgi:hypothetical protein